MDVAKKQAAQQGWLDTIKNKFEAFIQQFEFSWAKVTEYGIALGGGIVCGFLVRRYGKQTILILLVLAALLGSFVYFEVITIDWPKVKELIGIAPANTIEAFFKSYLQWAQAHFITVIMSIVGFIIGYKIG